MIKTKKRILILGGYGNTGRRIAGLLLRETDAPLILAGRNTGKLEQLSTEFNTAFGKNRTAWACVDASDGEGLKKIFSDADIVVVASSTAEYTETVASAALYAGIDYFDVQYSTNKLKILQSLSSEIEKAGRCFITDGGFHPGLPAVLIRYIAPRFDRLDSAVVGSVIQVDWAAVSVSDSTIAEFLKELSDYRALTFKNNTWTKAGFRSMMFPRSMQFGAPFGRRCCMPMFLEEMQAVPEMYPSLRETGFYVGGFNWFVDWLFFPLAIPFLKAFPTKSMHWLARPMHWGLKRFSSPPYGTLLKIEASGQKNERIQKFEMTLYHKDGYMFTAIPAVACLLQVMDGTIRKPGLWFQSHIVEPKRFMEDTRRLGVKIEEKINGQSSVH